MSADLALDLDAYLQRIGWQGELRRDLDTLTRLQAAHMGAIPFENLDVLLGRGIRIDLASVQRKLVQARRGGYCFEHVTLFAAVLEALGFEPVRHIGRVTMVVPVHQAPRTHMMVSVVLPEGRFVCDPGFGGLAPRVPVPVDGTPARIDDEAHTLHQQDTPHGPRWTLHAQVGGRNGERSLNAWVTDFGEVYPVDFELGNHFTSSHRDSGFVNRLMLRALTPDGRVTVMNRDVTIWRGTQPESFQLADRAALRELLATYFGFDLPEVLGLRIPTVPEWA